MTIRKPKKADYFAQVVRNALAFATTAGDTPASDPKRSLIDFAIAVELFLKARLLREHWALVIQDPGEADREKFARGMFRSVSSTEAVKRLGKISGVRFEPHEVSAFQRLADHRNQLIHFFHPRYSNASDAVIAEVVVEQIGAWFYLHRLLTQRWQSEFSAFQAMIKILDTKVRSHRQYLEGRFNAIQPELVVEANGSTIAKCARCEFQSLVVREDAGGLWEERCAMCDSRERLLRVACSHCDSLVEIRDMGEGVCVCGKPIHVDELVDMLDPMVNPQEDPPRIKCPECCWVGETVVPWSIGYLCVYCFRNFEGASSCDRCGERIAGERSLDTFLVGCESCEGQLSWESLVDTPE